MRCHPIFLLVCLTSPSVIISRSIHVAANGIISFFLRIIIFRDKLNGELETEMAAHSSILAWKIPWTEEPGGLQFIGSQESDQT